MSFQFSFAGEDIDALDEDSQIQVSKENSVCPEHSTSQLVVAAADLDSREQLIRPQKHSLQELVCMTSPLLVFYSDASGCSICNSVLF